MKLFNNKKMLKITIVCALFLVVTGCNQNSIDVEKTLDTAIQNFVDAGSYKKSFKSTGTAIAYHTDDKESAYVDENSREIYEYTSFNNQSSYKITSNHPDFERDPYTGNLTNSNDVEFPYTSIERWTKSDFSSLGISEEGYYREVDGYNHNDFDYDVTINELDWLKYHYGGGAYTPFFETTSKKYEDYLTISFECTDPDGYLQKSYEIDKEIYPELTKQEYNLIKCNFTITIDLDGYITKIEYINSHDYGNNLITNTESIETYENIGKIHLNKIKIDQYLEQAEEGIISEGSVIEYPLS